MPAMKQSIVLNEAPIEQNTDGPPGPVRVHVTDRDRRFETEDELPWRTKRGASSSSIDLNPGETFQEVLGFGAALTDAACYLLDKLPAPVRREFLRELFDPAAMGLNTCRICIGASDYAVELYGCDEGSPDPDLERFSIDHDRAYILPILKEARELCPELFLVATPWSPPGWMKVGGSMRGGSIQRKHFATYAEYFRKFLEGYATAGVPVDAVTVQNEVDTDQDGLMPACLWSQSSEMQFIAEHLASHLTEGKIGSKIWLLDHNYDLWGRVLSELANPKVRQSVDGVAWHGYAGEPSSMTVVHKAYPDKHMYWTEGGPEDFNDPHLETNWTLWGVRFTDIMSNWARCIIAWNLMLDENGRPNIGPFACAGLVTVDSGTKRITRNGQYWALAHFSRAIRRGARRIGCRGTIKKISRVAFLNPDGSHAMVLTNSGRERTVLVRLESAWEAEVVLPPDSLVTLQWHAAPRGRL
jgi:glucosylceramidase